VSFETFDFDQELINAINNAKFNRSSKLQQLVIPEILTGHDILASAHSGSGKSASFILPLIQRLLRSKQNAPLEQPIQPIETSDDIQNHVVSENNGNVSSEAHQNLATSNTEISNIEALNIEAPSLNVQNKEATIQTIKPSSVFEPVHDMSVNAALGNIEPAEQSNVTIENVVQSDNDQSPNKERPKNGPKVLVLAPTRELANQISACIRRFTRELDLRYGLLVGGAPYGPQVRMLNKPIDFLVATPGRLLDHLKNNRVNFDKIEYFVINEVNRMIDMKMQDDLYMIESHIPKISTLHNGEIKKRQTLLFADNLEGNQLKVISKDFQNNPLRFALAKSKQSYRALNQDMYITDEGDHKHKIALALIEKSDSNNIVMASHSEEELNSLKNFLIAQLNNIENNSTDTQSKLTLTDGRNLFFIHDAYKLDNKHLLKTTSDIKVIHLTLPDDLIAFLQRLELLIDQNSEQVSNLLIAASEWSMLNQIERYIGKTLSRKKIQGLEPESTEPRIGSKNLSSKAQKKTTNRNPYNGRRQNTKRPAGKQKQDHQEKNQSAASKNKRKPQNSKRNQATKSKKPNKTNGNSANHYDMELDNQPILTSYELGNNSLGNSQNQHNIRNSNTGSKKKNTGKKNNQAHLKAKKTNTHRNRKPNNPQQNKANHQKAGNAFNSDGQPDERDLSWKQYISNISNGNGNGNTQSNGKGNTTKKNNNKNSRKRQNKQNGSFDINHSPMAISAKKVRDIAKNEEWASEKKEANKPNVQIRVKHSVKAKINNSDSTKSHIDDEGNRIGGKLGITK